jgi:DNA modification methylase
MLGRLTNSNYALACCDGAEGMLRLPDRSIKLVYGSPPYPNAERDYGVWKASEYIDKISPFLSASILKLRGDGFLVINVKANREKATSKTASKRSLVVERLAILLEERWGLHCVDIEIWVKENPVPTGLRVACQDAYEQNLWFSKAPKWRINLDAVRRPYEPQSVKIYGEYEYKPRSNGLTYVRKNKRIQPNPLGALPKNVISGGVSSRIGEHQATQPLYLPEKYIKATTNEGDLVVDPWVGSGTTGVAALSLNRKFVGFDIVESYLAEAKRRFEHAQKGR